MFSTMYSNDVYLLDATNARYTSASSFKEIDVLYDYDGVYELQPYVLDALRKAGWTVPEDF